MLPFQNVLDIGGGGGCRHQDTLETGAAVAECPPKPQAEKTDFVRETVRYTLRIIEGVIVQSPVVQKATPPEPFNGVLVVEVENVAISFSN